MSVTMLSSLDDSCPLLCIDNILNCIFWRFYNSWEDDYFFPLFSYFLISSPLFSTLAWVDTLAPGLRQACERGDRSERCFSSRSCGSTRSANAMICAAEGPLSNALSRPEQAQHGPCLGNGFCKYLRRYRVSLGNRTLAAVNHPARGGSGLIKRFDNESQAPVENNFAMESERKAKTRGTVGQQRVERPGCGGIVRFRGRRPATSVTRCLVYIHCKTQSVKASK